MQKLELNVDEVVVLENSHGQDIIVLNCFNSEAIKKTLPVEARLFFDGMLSIDIKTSSMHGERLAKELGLIPDRVVKV
mgnify:FL=1